MSKKPNYVFDDETELCHYGIPNQKWGHRRFQNEDGSLTPEGRERYGVGDRIRNLFKIRKSDQQIKADEQKAKAKISYNTQKYKANLKSKAQKEKDARAAEEERNRLKEQAKTEKMLKKEQGKIDRTAQKERSKTEQDGRPLGMKFTRTRKMSDEDLEKAVNRLKLQAEYNKQYVLATQPNGALAKADRFFDGPTGKAALDLAKAVLPGVASSATTAILNAKLKYVNKEDRDKVAAETAKKLADTEKVKADIRYRDAETRSKDYELESKKATNAAEEKRNEWRFEQEKDNAAYARAKDAYQFKSDMKDAELKRRMDASKHNHEVDIADQKARTEDQITRTKAAQDAINAKNEAKWKKMEMEGYEEKDGAITRKRIGVIAKNANDRELQAIYGQKAYDSAQRKTDALNKQEVLAKQIANEQGKANVVYTRAQAENIKANTYNTKAEAKNKQASANLANAQAQSVATDRRLKLESNYRSQFRNLEAQGYTQEEIADRYGVSIYTIRKILGK